MFYANIGEYVSNKGGMLNNSGLPDIFKNKMYGISEPKPIPSFTLQGTII